MFSIFGLIITVYGLATIGNDTMYARSLDINVNLVSGILTLLFGLIMLLFSGPVKKLLKRK
jgi:uncharacterized protein YhhL (DUF1145 family)